MIYIQMTDSSPIRKRLRILSDEIPSLVRVALRRSLIWRGLVYEARRKCGKPNCRCADGELHVSDVLSDRSGTKQRNIPLAGKTLVIFTRMTEEYRKVRKSRARFVKITKEMVELFDRLEEIRREEALGRHGGKLPPPHGEDETS